MRKKHRYKLDKSIIFKRFLEDLAARYGTQAASAIWADAEAELGRLTAAHPDAERRDHTLVFPAVALYRSIENKLPGDALVVTRAYGTKTGNKLRNIIRRLTLLPGFPLLIWKKMPQSQRK